MVFSLPEYRSKVMGCWMGKNIGGTVGAPFEWKRQVNDITFYTQDLGGNPLPNDDLDLQLLWLIALEQHGLDLNARTLGEYWLHFIPPHWGEYGNGKINLRSGLVPPLSGIERNPFKDSCGAYIRSEIWACIAPGNPALAAKYAYEDAIVDHGDGEGMYAEIFTATMESAAFVVEDIAELIGIGLSYIPESCGIAGAVRCAQDCFARGLTWREARETMLEQYRGGCQWFSICEEDRKKGFAEGRLGWDAPSNIGLMVVGLLYGGGDFEKTMQITVNCGEDTDCTAATAGALFGLIHGFSAIPERWIAPIGKGIKTISLNSGDLMSLGNVVPTDIDDLCRRTERIARLMSLSGRLGADFAEDGPGDTAGITAAALRSPDAGGRLYRCLKGPVYRFDYLDVLMEYPDGAYARPGAPTRIRVTLENTDNIPAAYSAHWYAPEGWSVTPDNGLFYSLRPQMQPYPVVQEFLFSCEHFTGTQARFVLELTMPGRHTAMLVPVVLLNGAVQ
jgi:ADP-ribosylglycohydrolase